MPETAYYFFRIRDNEVVKEFCVANAKDPNQYVESTAPDGSKQRWDKRWDCDLLVFHPPDGYSDFQPLGWVYDKRLQNGEPVPQEEMERLATNMRVSAHGYPELCSSELSVLRNE